MQRTDILTHANKIAATRSTTKSDSFSSDGVYPLTRIQTQEIAMQSTIDVLEAAGLLK